MKDVAGQELAVGDRVAYLVPNYRELQIGVVAHLTPTGVAIKVSNTTKYRHCATVVKVPPA